ncbi:Na+/H+ antiporter [Sphingomonas xinjiangensis]|uniref:CPA1 family monovalent cation:H+ antiporter n=1 Tax=Sphingomonas xinjiangensis TaxID=643568 RepID=A0A840YS35_9SPHN|nr:Na+/H+ antiporter [Sphingomonas xinjiangensis]MBB5712487.1 CPA1 family monovalent cation:H+ antiporter [Sphingomonas xinjiangensis]
MLVAVLALHYVARRLNLPPAAALLVGGGGLAFLPGLPSVELDPELVLVLFLPPLLMDGAWFTALAPFRRNLAGILSLAIGAVLFTAIVVACVAKTLIPGLPWAACIALGAIVSPPDAVAARAVLQRVRLPRRLTALLEGESLLNDATGLVLFRFAVAAVLTGSFSLAEATGSFVVLVVGGVLVGGGVGGLWVRILRSLEDDNLMIALSALVCWLAYIAGELLHVSGVIATVTAGLVCGWYQHVVFSASVRVRAVAFWKVMTFLLEAAVFVLIGFSLRGVLDRLGGPAVVLETMAQPVLLIVLTVLIARFLWIFGADLLVKLLRSAGARHLRPLGSRASLVMSWAGMRGVVTLAVALTLPDAMPGRDLMLVTAFAVIFMTVLLQGTTLGAVIKLARPAEEKDAIAPMNLHAAETAMFKAQFAAVERLAFDGDGELLHPQLLDRYRTRATASSKFELDLEERTRRIIEHFDIVLAAVAAGRAELVRLHRNGQIERAISRNDGEMHGRIEQAYLSYSRQQIQYYSDLNAKVLGYRPPEIIVLHLNSLNAAVADRLLKVFKELDYRFVSLAEAQSDRAYQQSPAHATRFGPMWGYRWARERSIKVDGSLEQEPPQWIATYAAGK